MPDRAGRSEIGQADVGCCKSDGIATEGGAREVGGGPRNGLGAEGGADVGEGAETPDGYSAV